MLVWDVPTRLFHWATVTLVVAAYMTWKLNWMDWHARAGYLLLTAVLFRILWGLFGSQTARFSDFLVSSRAAALHLAQALRREPDRQAGHNPAGGWMVVVLLLLLLGETLTGVYVANDVANEGTLTEMTPAFVANAITSLHGILWDALVMAVALHLLAIIVYMAVKGQQLLIPMLTGYKTLPTAVPRPRIAGTARALILLGCSVAAVAVVAHVL